MKVSGTFFRRIPENHTLENCGNLMEFPRTIPESIWKIQNGNPAGSRVFSGIWFSGIFLKNAKIPFLHSFDVGKDAIYTPLKFAKKIKILEFFGNKLKWNYCKFPCWKLSGIVSNSERIFPKDSESFPKKWMTEKYL